MPARLSASFASRLEYKWLVVVSITLGMFMSILDSTIVNVAIPTMRRQFHADLAGVQWVVTVYMITQAAVIPAAPYLTSRWGSKRAYVWTLASFLAGSMLCGFAWNLPSLVFFRFVQGLGGGVLLPMVMALLYSTFPQEERGRASSAMGVPLMAAPLLGPVVGGYLVSHHGWPWAFFINAPLGVVALWIASSVLRSDEPDPNARLDAGGLALAGLGSSATLFGLSGVASEGVASARGLALLVGIAALASFVPYEFRMARSGRKPLVDLRRFTDRTFAFSVLGICFQMAALFGTLFLVPIYLQTLRGQTSERSGEIQASQALATLATTFVAGRLADRHGPKPVALVGSVIFIAALASLATLSLTTPLLLVAALLVPVGLGASLAGQATLCAMANIGKDERQEVTNGSTILSVLRATAAPLGVVLVSGLVQLWSRPGGGESTMHAMRGAFFVSALLVVAATVALAFAPKGSKASAPDVPLSME